MNSQHTWCHPPLSVQEFSARTLGSRSDRLPLPYPHLPTLTLGPKGFYLQDYLSYMPPL